MPTFTNQVRDTLSLRDTQLMTKSAKNITWNLIQVTSLLFVKTGYLKTNVYESKYCS